MSRSLLASWGPRNCLRLLSLHDEFDRGFEAAGKAADGTVDITYRGIGVFSGGIAVQDNVIVGLNLCSALTREIGQEDVANSHGIGLDLLDEIGRSFGDNGCGEMPRAVQRIAQQAGIAALDENAFREHFQYTATNEPPVLQANRAELFGADGGGFIGFVGRVTPRGGLNRAIGARSGICLSRYLKTEKLQQSSSNQPKSRSVWSARVFRRFWPWITATRGKAAECVRTPNASRCPKVFDISHGSCTTR